MHMLVFYTNVMQMTELFGEVAHRMPLELVEPVEKMINKDIRYRSTAQGFMQVRQVFQQVKYSVIQVR